MIDYLPADMCKNVGIRMTIAEIIDLEKQSPLLCATDGASIFWVTSDGMVISDRAYLKKKGE